MNTVEDDQQLHLDRGIQYYEQGLIIEGLKCFELLVSKYKNIDALARLVNHHIRHKNVNKLLNLLPLLKAQCLERATNDIAQIYFLAKDYENALEYSLKSKSLHMINNYMIGVCYVKLSKFKDLSVIINGLNDSSIEMQELTKMVEKKYNYVDLAIEYLTKCCENASFEQYRSSCYYLGCCCLKKKNFSSANLFLQYALKMREIKAAALLGYSMINQQDEDNSDYYFLFAKNNSRTVEEYKHLIKYLKICGKLSEAIQTTITLLSLIREERKICCTESRNNRLRYNYEKHQVILKDLLIDMEINLMMMAENGGPGYEEVDFQVWQDISEEYLFN